MRHIKQSSANEAESLNRYDRHSLIDWFSQDDIKNTRLCVIGAGAVGNEVLKNLALIGVGCIDVYDFDRVEIHNLTRSVLFRERDIGFNKADVATTRARDLDPSTRINSFPGNFWQTLPLQRLVNYDCVICCVDNFEARLRINQLCKLAAVNLVNTGIDSRYVSVDLFPFASGHNVGCYECNLPDSVYQRIRKRYSCAWLRKLGYVENKIPTTIITSSMAGSLAVSIALRLGKVADIAESQRLLVDTISPRLSQHTLARSKACAGCGYFEPDIHILSAIAAVDTTIPRHLLRATQDFTVRTSDQLIVHRRCTNCGRKLPVGEDEEIKRAADFDDSLLVCPHCKLTSVQLDIRDEFSLVELLDRYPGSRLPVKFVTLNIDSRTIVIDFEGAYE